jgi:hypothetical protein
MLGVGKRAICLRAPPALPGRSWAGARLAFQNPDLRRELGAHSAIPAKRGKKTWPVRGGRGGYLTARRRFQRAGQTSEQFSVPQQARGGYLTSRRLFQHLPRGAPSHPPGVQLYQFVSGGLLHRPNLRADPPVRRPALPIRFWGPSSTSISLRRRPRPDSACTFDPLPLYLRVLYYDSIKNGGQVNRGRFSGYAISGYAFSKYAHGEPPGRLQARQQGPSPLRIAFGVTSHLNPSGEGPLSQQPAQTAQNARPYPYPRIYLTSLRPLMYIMLT